MTAKFLLTSSFKHFFKGLAVGSLRDNILFVSKKDYAKMSNTRVTVCNFQSMKSPMKLNSLLLKFFCCVTWFEERRHWRRWKQGLFIKSYCLYKTIV